MEIYGFIDGAKKSLTQLAAESGVSYDTLLSRYKAGVPFGELVDAASGGGVSAEELEGLRTELEQYVDAAVADIPDGSITTEKLATGAVTNGKLAAESVGTSKIIDGCITTAKLGSGVTAYALNGVQSDLLWTNASMGSSFAAQTISKDLTAYNKVLVHFRRETGVTRTVIGECARNGSGLANLVATNSSSAATAYNRVFSVSDTGVTFEAAYTQKTNSTTRSTDNSALIPVRFYGIRGNT